MSKPAILSSRPEFSAAYCFLVPIFSLSIPACSAQQLGLLCVYAYVELCVPPNASKLYHLNWIKKEKPWS